MAELRSITLSDGRNVGLRTPGPDQMLDLILGVGAEASSNPTWMNYAVHAASVVELDGQPLPFPMNEGAVKNVLRKLGTQGFGEVYQANLTVPGEDTAANAVREDPAKN